ncbi:MAG TPA: hypothetical protein VJL84_08835 [Kiloniellales bacterium]|nr:hypothetical protein [Kiloniellales bacterium]
MQWPSSCRLLAAALLSLGLAACTDDSGQPLVTGLPDEPEPPVCPVPPPEALGGAPLTLATFTIDGIGVYSTREDEALACLVAPYDLVVVHDLGAPPYPGTFGDGEAYRPAQPAADFFDAMRRHGFDYVMAPEDTGHVPTNKLNSGLTVWPVTFYKPDRVRLAQDRPSGYIDPDRTANPSYDRVPFALAFVTADGFYDFYVVSVDLAEGREKASRRRFELGALTGWLSQYAGGERDVFVSGGFDFNDCSEVAGLPPILIALDDNCQATNVSNKRPTAGWLVLEGPSAEITGEPVVLDMIREMQPFWVYTFGEGYPGDPLNYQLFASTYSGHKPVILGVIPPSDDAD